MHSGRPGVLPRPRPRHFPLGAGTAGRGRRTIPPGHHLEQERPMTNTVVTDPGQINDTRKAELLSREVKHIDIRSFDARPIIEAMDHMSFTSRDLARATGIYNQMLADPDCSVFLVIAGSTSAGGCMDLYAELVRSNMVDGIVATGASIVDMDFFEGLGHKHYQAQEIPDDMVLRSLYIDRIYDTYIDEEQLQDCDHTIGRIANSLEPKAYSSRAFIRAMGKYLVEHGKKENSLVKLAYEHDVPIFCPAFVDSSAGFGLVKHQVDRMKAGQPYLVLDAIADFRELTEIKIKAGTTGLLMIGGGVPKNFVQDTVVCAEILGHDDVEMHKYAVQITVADVRDGACSSSTLKEAASWGKVDTALEQMVFAEAGSVMPLLASDAWHRGLWKNRPKRRWARIFND
jgi:deoxyhypusine synthase